MDRPNVVIVVMDTARADVVSQFRDTDGGIGSLASAGTYYHNAYTSSPWTLPSHASLFSGQYASKHGAHAGHKRLDDSVPLVAERFSDAGYETVALSNNTWISREFGFDRGFETFVKNWQYVQSDTDLGEIARLEEGWNKIRKLGRRLFSGNPLTNFVNAVYGQFVRNRMSDDGASGTNDWISNWVDGRDDDNPFFLFINYLEPHLEYRPSKEFAKRYLPSGVEYDEAMDVPQDAWGFIADSVSMNERDFEILHSLYKAEIAYLDQRIKELQETLRAANEWENTIFVLTGDHGENIGDHGLMDHQYCLYDTLLHVPLIVRGGPFDGGNSVRDFVQLTDVPLTLLDAAGISAPEFREQSQGISFSPDTDSSPRNFLIGEYLAPQPSIQALRERVGTLPEPVRRYDRSLRSIRTDNWKLIRGSDDTRELYNLAQDQYESTDLADDRDEKVTELERRLDEWLRSFNQVNDHSDVVMREETRNRLEDLGYLQ